MAFLKGHEMERVLREVPCCDHCGTPLEPLYYKCKCGRELHISCRRSHESFVKMDYKHATALLEPCSVCSPSFVCGKCYDKIIASKPKIPDYGAF